MTVSRTVVIDVITANTVTIRTSRAAHLLDDAGVPRQYNPELKCWMTSRRTLPDLLAWLDVCNRPVVYNEMARLL